MVVACHQDHRWGRILKRRHPRNPIKVDGKTQPRNEGTYDTLEALEVIDRTKGPDERAVHGQCAGRTCPMKMMVALLDELRRARGRGGREQGESQFTGGRKKLTRLG